MAIFNLYDGGTPAWGLSCPSCQGNYNEEIQLPRRVQPDNRVDGGYQGRAKREFKDLFATLKRRYGKDPEDIQVKDKIRIFIQPNYSQTESIFADVLTLQKGLEFSIKHIQTHQIEGAEKGLLTTEIYSTDCSQEGETSYTTLEDQDRISVTAESMQEQSMRAWLIFNKCWNTATAAVEIEITATPPKGIVPELSKILLARKYEKHGYMMVPQYQIG